MKNTLLLLLLTAACALASGCTNTESGYEQYDRLSVGDAIPSFDLGGLEDGEPVAISSADFAGRQGLIVFFSYSCGDCHREMPKIEQVWNMLGGDPDVRIAVVSRDGSAEDVADYWASTDDRYGKTPFTMPYYFDPGRELYGAFAEQGVPRIYVIDRSGVIREIFRERLPLDAAELAALVKSME